MLHKFNGEPYYLGVFLVGAYQEILGDLHNLLATRTPCTSRSARTASITPKARASSTSSRATPSRGAEVRRVRSGGADGQAAPRRRSRDQRRPHGRHAGGRLLKFYEEALMGYTYLEDPTLTNSPVGQDSGSAVGKLSTFLPFSLNSRWRLTSGHSSSRIEYITDLRTVPSRRAW